jgi:bifunctional non-homologous end joining protein LigD
MASRTQLADLPEPERALARSAVAPTDAQLMKAVMCREPFSDPAWIYERKLDGIRCFGIRDGSNLRILSRNDHDLSGRFPEVHDALAAQTMTRFAVDGEVVAFDGVETSFARLAARAQHPVPVFFYVFDLLWIDGQDIRALPLRARKQLLRGLLKWEGALRLSSHRDEAGVEMFKEACQKGWEGVVAKRAEAPYSAARSRDWLKFKCEAGQELVVGGFTEPGGARTDFGALLVGYYEGGELQYAGKVGTGFDQKTLTDLGTTLRGIAVSESPFARPEDIQESGVTWVKPELVGQIGFAEWTAAGRLRQPRFQGLRDDKSATEVVREQ